MLLAEFRNVNARLQMGSSTLPMKWEAPPNDVFKVNLDASCAKHRNSVGLGVVIRDSRGVFYAGMSNWVVMQLMLRWES